MERSGLDFGALGLDFGGPGPRFWRVWGSKWGPSKWQAAKNAEICQELAETWQLSAKVFLDGGMGEPRVAKKGGAAVDPPWGFSMELEPSWPFWPPKISMPAPFDPLKLDVF